MSVDYRIGDTRELCAALPDRSVNLVATSPPFLALRSYLPADHVSKHAEIGSEPDPATFLDTLLGLTAEWGRVLTDDGSIAIELGDTYAGGSAQGTDQGGSERYPNGRGQAGLLAHTKSLGEWPQAKSLALIPQLYATSLAYGRNLLTGEPSPAGRWLVRNMIVWHRPNPAVGALGDKFRPSTSYITVATRSPKRWFDLTAVRTEHSRANFGNLTTGRMERDTGSRSDDGKQWYSDANPAGAPPLDCWFDGYDEHDTWTITTQPSRLAHYAMWPPKLAERLILSMCPEQVCTVCGTPRRRIEGAAEYVSTTGGRVVNQWAYERVADGVNTWNVEGGNPGHAVRTAATIGWTECACAVAGDKYRPGVVLDPFAGTFTTGLVAELHGRHGIGFDLNPANADLVEPRRAEVKRALFGTAPELPGQLDMFGGAV